MSLGVRGSHVSGCKRVTCQWVYEDHISRVETSLILFISNLIVMRDKCVHTQSQHRSSFFQNQLIFIQLDELDKLELGIKIKF